MLKKCALFSLLTMTTLFGIHATEDAIPQNLPQTEETGTLSISISCGLDNVTEEDDAEEGALPVLACKDC